MSLFDDTSMKAALAALRRLSEAFLEKPPPDRLGPSIGGSAGAALVHAALEDVFPNAGHAARAREALLESVEGLARTNLLPTLYGGFVGTAWAYELVAGNPELPSEQDPNSGVDAALIEHLDHSPWTKTYDLVGGLVGIGVYALERMPRPSAKRMVSLVIDRLEEMSQRRPPGIAWKSDIDWVAPKFREFNSHLVWNLGLAHGIPGIVGFLARVVASAASSETRARARVLLEGAVTWLLAEELPASSQSMFSTTAGPEYRKASRVAWCYGDPGVAAALFLAARAAGHREWEEAAMRAALKAASRPEGQTGVIDAGLCHGTAGLGHMFHRFYRETSDERFAEASIFWFGRTLEAQQEGQGYGGFLAYRGSEEGWAADASFLTGAAGVALALAAAVTGQDPVWDRVLLLS